MSTAPGQAVVAKYLATYAEAEARIPLALDRPYEAVLVLPVLGEAPSLLQGLTRALGIGPSLLIVVLNATETADQRLRQLNTELETWLTRQAGERVQLCQEPAISLLRLASFDVLLVDRSSPGQWLPEGEGVGLARRIGADIALSLKARGLVRARGFGCTDADVELPEHYFEAGEVGIRHASAALFPFEHLVSDDTELGRATALYELSLRYYVLGLAHAGSCYAYQSLGSTLYVDFDAYARVRGFPKRRAGEDFYLLDKLAKLGTLRRLHGPTIRIRARRSERVPYGTGPGVRRLIGLGRQGSELKLYAPQSFEVLRHVLSTFSGYARTRDLERVRLELAALSGAEVVLEYLHSRGFIRALSEAARQAPSAAQLERRLSTWFDALKTLRLIHALRERCLPMLGYRQALSEAPFTGGPAASPTESLRALREQEAELGDFAGVARGRSGPPGR